MSPEESSQFRSLIARRWQELPPAVRTERQVAGRGGIACGATWGIMERCNFACTSCYLTELGNHAEPLPFAEARAQLDTLREHLGPGGKVQITSGEVTLLTVEQLGRIVRYALDLGLDPMVMTNGERFREDEDYLVRLVRDYGLRKVSLHIDTTQRGRRWTPQDPRAAMPHNLREAQLHPLRRQFAALLERVAARTGVTIHAAHTITLTSGALDEVASITREVLRLPAFRLLSILPVATVGRTRDGSDGLTLDGVWRRVQDGAGAPLHRDAMQFGHRECNVTVPVLVLGHVGRGDDEKPVLVEVVRSGSRWDRRVFGRILRELPVYIDFNDGLLKNARRMLGVALRRPGFGLEFTAWGLWRTFGIAVRAAFMLARARLPQPRAFLFVIHKFMDPDELGTPLGRERLASCVFKLPLPGGELVSMCEMNATDLRHRLNLDRMPEGSLAR